MLGVTLVAGAAVGQVDGDIQVSVTNEGNSDFFLTPTWFAFQDGSFDFFDVGSPASASLEAIAEDGVVDGLVNDFMNSGVPGNIQGVAANADGFGGAPVIDPGETATAFVTPINTAGYQYFSFASMLIPTNDTFIGNDNPLAYRVFDDNGDILGAGGVVTIQIFGADLWDAGTEVNDGLGAPFSVAGGTATDEFGVVTSGPDLSAYIGLDTPAGTTILNTIDSGELLATIQISIVPAPSTAAILGLAGLGMMRRKR
ncbi:MAG: hypothetical protein COB69_01020 [Phycisphaera sp.]|nr:MAG: hypothetical protein COB69_01020 [Phycisphaera sp.]